MLPGHALFEIYDFYLESIAVKFNGEACWCTYNEDGEV
jgi:hypothetical protein